jgi:hypothetical protein
MRIFRRHFLIFITGLTALLTFGYRVLRKLQTPAVVLDPGEMMPDDFVLPEAVTQVTHRADGMIFRVDRKRKTACAFSEETDELIWESRGEDDFIVPGVAFPLDLSPDGELWVANVGRKRLEQLDPKTGRFIASWEPRETFGGCCNPVRFAALSGGRFLTVEKGVRRICIYQPSGELERLVTDGLSPFEANYYLYRDGNSVKIYDTGAKKYWEVSYDDTMAIS